MEHNEKYKSIQVNLSLIKHKDLINWLIEKSEEEETSFNSIIIRALKREYLRDAEQKNNTGLQ